MENFWRLKVVEKMHKIVLEVYRITAKLPAEEKLGLTSQIRRCAVSVVANIVEATKRKTLKDKKNFFNISQGSLEELKYYLFLICDLGYITEARKIDIINKCCEAGAMLNNLSSKLKY